MVRIDDQDFKISLQQVKHGFPIHPRCLEGDMTASLLFKPITKF